MLEVGFSFPTRSSSLFYFLFIFYFLNSPTRRRVGVGGWGGNWLDFLRTIAGYLADKERNSSNNQRHGQKKQQHWSEFPELQSIVFILNKSLLLFFLRFFHFIFFFSTFFSFLNFFSWFFFHRFFFFFYHLFKMKNGHTFRLLSLVNKRLQCGTSKKHWKPILKVLFLPPLPAPPPAHRGGRAGEGLARRAPPPYSRARGWGPC